MMKRTLPALLLFSSLPALAAEPAASPWKNIPLGDAATLSFDGSLRERYEWTDQRDLSGGRDDTFMQRLLIGARLDYGDDFGAYVQLGSSLATPRDRGRKPTDEDHAYLGQGYVDLKLPTAYGLGTLRVGRQEIALGSLHLMGTRDGPNVRR
ncbi:alginate export family protein, partial [Serratia marcescens]